MNKRIKPKEASITESLQACGMHLASADFTKEMEELVANGNYTQVILRIKPEGVQMTTRPGAPEKPLMRFKVPEKQENKS